MRETIYTLYYTAPNRALLCEQFYTFGQAADRALECRAAGCTEIRIDRERWTFASTEFSTVMELTDA